MPYKACFDKAAELIGSAENILVTTHRKPDGDACGSVSALAEVLKAQGKEVTPLMLSTMPQWYGFVFAEQPAVLGEDISIEQLQQRIFDLVIIADTNSYSQLTGMEEYLRRHRDSVVVF
jgi:phosphoesterase RecJ-like protein